MSTTRKIQSTKNYRMFTRCQENRPTKPKDHKRLERSMRKYGFLQSFPIVVHRNGDKHLIVKDGQHRLQFAETLGLPVYFVEEPVDFDVSEINCTSQIWKLRDFAQTFAAKGLRPYEEGLAFADEYKLPIGTAFALLSGVVTFGHCHAAFTGGTFVIKDRRWADSVAALYSGLNALSPVLKNARLLEACMAVCRVKDFDNGRLLSCAERCREKLVAYSTKEAYLQMLDEIYNFGKQKRVALRFEAEQAMKKRSAVVQSKEKAAAKRAKEAVA